MIVLLWLGTAISLLGFGAVVYSAGHKRGRHDVLFEQQEQQDEHYRATLAHLDRQHRRYLDEMQRLRSPERRWN